MHTVFALLCFVVVIHWLIFPYPSGLLHWHCGNLTIAPVPAKQPWWIWINTSCEFIMNDCITTTKQSTTKPCAYFLGYTVPLGQERLVRIYGIGGNGIHSEYSLSFLCCDITLVSMIGTWMFCVLVQANGRPQVLWRNTTQMYTEYYLSMGKEIVIELLRWWFLNYMKIWHIWPCYDHTRL